MSTSEHDGAGDLLIQEVDEELRHEQYRELWKRYGHYVVGAVVGIVLVVAGYQGWQGWQTKLRQQEAAQFSAAQALAMSGKTAEAAEALAKLAADSQTGYGVVAQLNRAQLLAATGDAAGALATYQQIVESKAPAEYRDLAVLKASLLALDNGDLSSLEPKLAGLTGADNPWRYSAIEVQALIARKKGDTAQAVTLFKQLADDPQAPRGLRTRATEMLAALPATPDKPKG